MPDKEKIIKECERAIGRIEDYGSTTMMSRSFFADVAKLLKEQEAVVRCKDCKHILPKGFCHKHSRKVADDWFCADGERKKDDA